MVGALEAVRDRDIARRQIDQAPGNKERRYLARAALLEQQGGIGDARQAADPGADHGAGGATALFGGGMPIGFVERLTRRTHGEDDEIVDLALVLRLHPLIGIEGAVAAVAARNHAGNPAGQIGDVKRLDLSGAAFAVEDALPGRLDATAEWRHHAEARDDNPPHIQHSSSIFAAHNKKPVDRSTTARPARQYHAGASALRVLLEKFYGIADGQNRLRGIVRNFATELFFKCHHELDGIEAVGAEVVDEARGLDHLIGFDTKVFDHDLLNSLANITHRSTSCLFHWTRPQRRYEPSRSLNFHRNRASS